MFQPVIYSDIRQGHGKTFGKLTFNQAYCNSQFTQYTRINSRFSQYARINSPFAG